MFNPKQNPKQVPSTPPTVSDKEGGMKGQGSSPVVAGDLVIARDEEDGLSFVGRLMAQGGPSGRGKGTVSLVNSQPRPTHLESQAPGDSIPIPPFLASDVLPHIPSLIACELAQYYQSLLTTNTPALESQVPGDLNPIPPFPTSDVLAHVPSLIACELPQHYQSLPTTNTLALEAIVPKEIAQTSQAP